MKQWLKSLGFAAMSIALSACATDQQWSGQTYAGGHQQYPDANQPFGNSASTVGGAETELGLINILMEQLGINQRQALGGLGSIFSMARQRMSPGDFSKISAVVPGMDRYLLSAPQQLADSPALWSSTAGMIGSQNNALGNFVALAGSFQSLGMNAEMIGQFLPVILQYVQQQGGAGTLSLLESALR